MLKKSPSFVKVSQSKGPGSPTVTGFYDEDTGSIQYIVTDPATGKAALIDVVMGFDTTTGATDTKGAEKIVAYAQDADMEIQWVLDTHPHADHFSASHWLTGKTGSPNGIGAKVEDVAEIWRDLYNEPHEFNPADYFDHLFVDRQIFHIGNLPVRVMHSPGHTLASVTYIVGDDAAFVHDTFMHVDFGTSRCDFPGGSAGELYDTLQAILALPDETRVFVGHDYCTDDRDEPAWESTVAEQRDHNTHIGGGVSREDFIKLRIARDETLDLPERMLFALQVNLRGGRLPQAEDDGNRYFRIPANRF